MQTIALRALALRLEKIERPKSKGIADGKLLSLLKAGELKAGFQFPGRKVRWIPIEPDYWQSVTSKRFQSIRSDGGGVFKVSIASFANTYIESLNKDTQGQNSKGLPIERVMEEFKTTLSAASRKYEVVVNAEEFERYKKSHNLVESSGARGQGGRHPLAAWRRLAVIIPAYLLANQEKHLQPAKHDQAGEQIRTYAIKKAGIDPASLPSSRTIEDIISEIYKLKEHILE